MARTVSAADAASGLSLRLLGGFELSRKSEVVQLALRAQRLIAFLALRDRPLTRIYVAGTLWLDANEARSLANLRAALCSIRRADVPAVEVRAVEASATHVWLTRGVRVDVHSLVAGAETLLAYRHTEDLSDSDCDNLTEECLRGDLLPDWYDDWVLKERERLRHLRLHALEVLAERLTLARRFGRAVEAALAAVHAEPLRESGQRALIKVHLAEGNTAEAVRCYRAYCDRLHDALALTPSNEMEELVATLAMARAP